MGTAEEVARQLSTKLGELFSREEKRTIPIFKGSPDDTDVKEWLREAERVARNNEWTDDQKLRFFSDRLKGDALEWHLTFTDEGQKTYKDWSTKLIDRFRDTTDVERLKTKLQFLKQKTDQRMKAYIAKVDSLYDSIHGRLEADPSGISQNELDIRKNLRDLRDGEKKKILTRGLLPKYKNELWMNMPEKPDYKSFTDALLKIELGITTKELNEEKTVNAITTDRTDSYQFDIEKLIKEVERLKTCNELSQEARGKSEETIAAVGFQQGNNDRKYYFGDRKDRTENDRYSRDHRRSGPQNSSYKSDRFNPREFNRSRSRDRSFSRDKDNIRTRSSSRDRNWRSKSPGSQDGNSKRGYKNFRGQYNSQNRKVTFKNNSFDNKDSKDPTNEPPVKNKLIDCYYCGKIGHISKECKKKIRDLQTKK